MAFDKDHDERNSSESPKMPSWTMGTVPTGIPAMTRTPLVTKLLSVATKMTNMRQDQSASRSMKKQRIEGDFVEGGSLCRNNSIHFGSISDMSILNTQQTEMAVTMLHKGISKECSKSSEGGLENDEDRVNYGSGPPNSSSSWSSLNETDPLERNQIRSCAPR